MYPALVASCFYHRYIFREDLIAEFKISLANVLQKVAGFAEIIFGDRFFFQGRPGCASFLLSIIPRNNGATYKDARKGYEEGFEHRGKYREIA